MARAKTSLPARRKKNHISQPCNDLCSQVRRKGGKKINVCNMGKGQKQYRTITFQCSALGNYIKND